MAVDRGSLQYTIDVDGTGPEKIREFRIELVKARRDWRAFKRDISRVGAASKSMAAGVTALALATRQAAVAARERAAALRKGEAIQKTAINTSHCATKAIKKETEAERRLREAKSQRIGIEKALERERRVGGSKKLRDLKVELALQRKLNKVALERALNERLRTPAIRAQLNADQKATELAKTQNTLAFERLKAQDQVLAKAKAELIVERQISKEKQKQLVNEVRIAQGLAPLGQKATKRAKTPLSPEQRAQARFASDLRNLKLNKRVGELKAASKEFQTLKSSMGAAGTTANRISFTFRRLFGIFAAFALVRVAVSGFRRLVADGVKFNAQIETARLGIAALFVATSDIRDAMGETVDKATQLALAQRESRVQSELLRKDALKTAATFEQLLDTFQIGIAPGIRAGLNIDEIRQFTVRISQAATALGVEQNQLAEEIRSILAGTIQLRTTRIAAALGITNEDIRKAKEAGILFEFLTEQFEAFGVAGEEALGTFAGLTGRVRDALLQLLGLGAIEFFDELKGLLADIFAGLSEETPDGLLRPNPAALSFIRGISQGLATAVQEARRLGKELAFGDLDDTSAAIGASIGLAAKLLSTAVEGIVAGLKLAGDIIDVTLIQPARALIDFFSGAETAVRDVLVIMIQILTTIATLVVLSKAIGLAFVLLKAPVLFFVAMTKLLKTLWIGIKASLIVVRSIFLLITSPIGIVLAAAVGLSILLGKWVEHLVGVKLKFTSILKLIKIGLVTSFKLAVLNIKLAWTTLVGFMQKAFRAVIAFVIDKSLAVVIAILELASIVSDSAGRQAKKLETERERLSKAEDKRAAKQKAEIERQKKQIRLAKERALIEGGDQVDRVLKDDKAAKTLGEIGASVIKSLKDSLGDVFGDGLLDGTVAQTRTLKQLFSEIGGILGQNRTELARQTDIVQELKDGIHDAAMALQFEADTDGASGGVLAQRKDLMMTQMDLLERTKDLEVELEDAALRRTGLLSRQVQIEDRVGQLTKDQRVQLDMAVRATKELLGIERAIGQEKADISSAQVKLSFAKATDDAEAARALRNELAVRTDVLRALEGEREIRKSLADLIITDEDPKARERIVKLVEEQILNSGKLKINEEFILAILSDREELEQQINDALRDRLATIALIETRQLRDDIRDLRQEFEALNRLAPFISALSTDRAGFRVEDATATRDEQAREVEFTKGDGDIQLRNLNETIELLRGKVASETELSELLEQRETLQQKINLELDVENQKLSTANMLLDEAIAKRDQPIEFGLAVGFADFASDVLDTFTAAREFMETTLEEFSDLISTTIADAFDPTTNTDIKERFGKFLLSIAQLIIKHLAALAITKLLSSLLGGADTGGPASAATMIAAAAAWVPVAIQLQVAADTLLIAASIQAAASGAGGFARGGLIPKRGYASGGNIPHVHARLARPKGLHHTDRTPIWAAGGEYMMRVAAVQKYGAGVMEQINRGLIDPMSLKGLSSVNKTMSVRAPKGSGFASGGLVSERVARSDAAPAGGGGPSLAIIVADDQAMDRLLAGGDSAMRKWAIDNADLFKGIVNDGN